MLNGSYIQYLKIVDEWGRRFWKSQINFRIKYASIFFCDKRAFINYVDNKGGKEVGEG